MRARRMEKQKVQGNSFGKIVCIAVGAVIGIAILKALGVGGAIGGGLGAFLGACVGEFVYRTGFKNRSKDV